VQCTEWVSLIPNRAPERRFGCTNSLPLLKMKWTASSLSRLIPVEWAAVMTRLRLDVPGSNTYRGRGYFCVSEYPDRLLGPSSLLFKKYCSDAAGMWRLSAYWRDVKMSASIAALSQYVDMAQTGTFWPVYRVSRGECARLRENFP